jgi:hypothetical protein
MQLERYGGDYKILPAWWSKSMVIRVAIDTERQAGFLGRASIQFSTGLISLEGGFGSIVATVNVLR